MQVEELTYNMVFDWSKKSFNGFNNSLESAVKGFAKITGAIAVAQGVSFAFAKSIANQNDELAKLSERLNISSQDYEKLSFGAKDFGASANDVTSSLRSLRKAQEDVLLGKGDIAAFSELGINPSNFEDTNDLFLAVADSISQIDSKSKRLNLMDRIGISENLVQMLESGSNNIRKMGEELAILGGVKTKEQLAVAGEFQGIFLRTATIVQGLSNLVGTELVGKYSKALKIINKFFIDNAKQITAAFSKFFQLLDNVSKAIVFVFDRVISLIQNITALMGGFENTVLAVSAAFIILKRNMILAFVVPLAIGTALFLILEDIVGFLSGKESAIGDFFGIDPSRVEAIGNFFDTLKSKFLETKLFFEENGLAGGIMKGFDTLGDSLVAFFDKYLKKFIEFIDKIKAYMKSAFSGMLGGVTNSLNMINPLNDVQTKQAQAVTTNNNNNANVNIMIDGANGDVVDQLENYFKTNYTSLFGNQ